MQRSFAANRDFWPLLAASLASLVAVLVAAHREYTPEWRQVQEDFRRYLLGRGAYAAAAAVPRDVQQIWLPALGRVDRCISCHLNYDGSLSSLPGLPPLYREHPELPYMERHPYPNFGCTVCHGGQGFATEKAAAHGEVADWGDPLLSAELAAQYGLSRAELTEMKCNACHRADDMTPAMDRINVAKELFAKKRCLSCHGFQGGGGLGASDLTYAGDNNPEHLDFSRVQGPQTALHWHIQHFKSPQNVVLGSGMPNYRFTDEEAKALALLVLSWRRVDFPPQYVPAARRRPPAIQPMVREVPVPPPATSPLGRVSAPAARDDRAAARRRVRDRHLAVHHVPSGGGRNAHWAGPRRRHEAPGRSVARAMAEEPRRNGGEGSETAGVDARVRRRDHAESEPHRGRDSSAHCLHERVPRLSACPAARPRCAWRRGRKGDGFLRGAVGLP